MLQRDDNGNLPAYAWPGGYAIVYYLKDGGCLCAACANGANGSEASEAEDAPADWRLVDADIYWEGPEHSCDHCGAAMPSEYGDPDGEEVDATTR